MAYLDNGERLEKIKQAISIGLISTISDITSDSISQEEFEEFVKHNWNKNQTVDDSPFGHMRDAFIMTAGLAGETGEVIELLKKEVRDHVLNPEELLLELGDLHHYFTKIYLRYGFTLEQIQAANRTKLVKRFIYGKQPGA